MKKFILLFLSLGIISCSSIKNTGGQKDNRIKSLSKSESSSLIKKLEEQVAPTLGSNIAFDSSELKKINNDYYLVSIHGEYTTTTLLKIVSNKAENLQFESAGISCTSKNCSSSNGCIPDSGGKKCTSCNHGAGDCTKTVSG